MAENTELRRRQFRLVSDWAGQGGAGRVVVAGDFNTPPESVLHRHFFSGFQNAFSQAGWGWGHTHFTRRTAVRIDHVLSDSASRVLGCWVAERVGSAHRPVIAELEWPAVSKQP
jgi:endonuclease/exonuclease/phosphatase (EEP) superfamily protein YafD